jgi:hypothetical protein
MSVWQLHRTRFLERTVVPEISQCSPSYLARRICYNTAHPSVPPSLVFTRLYPTTPTINTGDKAPQAYGTSPQDLLAATFVNITKHEQFQTRAIQLRRVRCAHLKLGILSGTGLTTAACQSKLALVVSMHIRNAGESFPRPFPRLYCDRRFGRRTSNSDVKCRTHSTCTSPFVWRPAIGLLPPAATFVSNPPPPAYRCGPSTILRYRDTSATPSVARATPTPPFHVASAILLIRHGLSTAPAAVNRRSQAEPSRRTPSATRSSKSSCATATAVWSAPTIYTSRPFPGILHPAISSTHNPATATPHGTPSSPPPPTSF